MLVYGARASPLGHFIGRSIIRRRGRAECKVLAVDTKSSLSMSRLPEIRYGLGCDELPTLDDSDQASLPSQVHEMFVENKITKVVDVTSLTSEPSLDLSTFVSPTLSHVY